MMSLPGGNRRFRRSYTLDPLPIDYDDGVRHDFAEAVHKFAEAYCGCAERVRYSQDTGKQDRCDRSYVGHVTSL